MNDQGRNSTELKVGSPPEGDTSSFSWPTLFPRLKTLQSRFLAVNVPLTLLSVIVVFGLFEVFSFRDSIHRLHERINELAASQSAVIAESLWHLDHDRIQVILEAITVDPDVIGAAVDDELGDRLATVGDLTVPANEPDSLHTHDIVFQTPDRAEKIGILTIVHTQTGILVEAKRRLLWGAMLCVLLIVSTLISSLVANWQTIGAPLNRLLEAITMAEKSHEHTTVNWNAKDEFGELVAAFNRMQNEQLRAEDELLKASEDLERRVEERTRELELARDEAEMANRSKTQFLRSMSHELRTPLNAIIGFSDLIQLQNLSISNAAQHREYAGDINKSAHFLLDIVNDLLDLSRIEADAFVPDESMVDPVSAVTASIDMVRANARAKNVEIVENLPASIGTVRVDERLIKQVFLNVLSNAVKFTDSGGKVEISVSLASDGQMSFRFVDNGRGIAPEDMEHIFEPFNRIVDPMISREEGTGLGLPLAKSLVELHGGHFDIRSRIDVGTTATITLPSSRVTPA